MTKPQVKKIEFLGINRKASRKLKVTLTNGTKITIEPCHESWEQYGGTTDELYVTLPLAEQYNGWLHGEEFPG